MPDWSKKFLEWTSGDKAYLSIAFTWDLPLAYQRAVWLRAEGYEVFAGGPAVDLMPNIMMGVARRDGQLHDVIKRHNPWATRTSIGCPRKCSFCSQSVIGQGLVEFDYWPVRPIVCDDNLLACSRAHFDDVIYKLKLIHSPYIDFNQGLDARLLTKYHADRLGELKCMVRLAFDSTKYESSFMRAFERLRKAGIPKSRIRVYVLVGYEDTPEDALYRLRAVHNLGVLPSPMRYNPLDTLMRDSYVGPGWTDSELRRYVRYWARLRFFRSIPFEEFR